MHFSRRRWLLSAAGSAFFAQVAKALQTPTTTTALASGKPATPGESRKKLAELVKCGVENYSDSSGYVISVPNASAFAALLDKVYKDRHDKKFAKMTDTTWAELAVHSVTLGAWIAYVQMREEKKSGAVMDVYLDYAREEFGWRRGAVMVPQVCLDTIKTTVASPDKTTTQSPAQTTTTTTTTTTTVTPTTTSTSCSLCAP